MHFENLIPVLSGSFAALLGYFVLVLCLDIALGVIRSLIALLQKGPASVLKIKPFDWGYLVNFAKSQLLSPPVLTIAGAVYLASIAPGASKQSIYAVAAATTFAQSLVLTRDIFVKVREIASLISFFPFITPAAK